MIIDVAELKKRYLKRIAGVRDKKIYVGPETVALDISNTCNLACRHCWIHVPENPRHSREARFLPMEKFVEIVSDCVSLNVDHLHITAAGEPATNPAFREMMRYLGQQPLRVSLFTNGTFPSDYCSDVIQADHVRIDFSASSRQQYRTVHGKDLFDRVVENIKRLVFLRKTSKPKFIIEIIYVENSLNLKQKSQMQEFAARLGVNGIYFKNMVVGSHNWGIALTDSIVSDLGSQKRRTPLACLNGWFYVRARSDYHASICCYIERMNIGSFDKKSFKQLWLSKRMMSMRLLGKYGYVQKMYKACQNCPFFYENIQRFRDLVRLEGRGKNSKESLGLFERTRPFPTNQGERVYFPLK